MASVMDMDSGASRDFIRTEVLRYTTTPTQQMSYLTGKLEIKRLLEAMKRRDGDNFSLKAFHDALLAEGSIPPALLWLIMGLDTN
jgi:uncharacterized protein (DUF885 family)